MNRTLTFVIVFLLILGGVLYWWSMRSNTPTTIVFITPSGREVWQPGEEHALSWSTTNVPPSHKVSITIRRIPPPTLQEEGQEFDPIVFTNLPNTGSVNWKISQMYPDGTYVLGINAYDSIPVTNEVSAESEEFTISHPKLPTDFYPLYSAADWQAPVVESFLIGTTTYSGASIISAPISAGMNPGSIFTAFENYYDKKLKMLGWKMADDLAAGGHVGGQTGYRKDGHVTLTRFQINYQTKPDNAPSECPCEITLSVFSTIKK